MVFNEKICKIKSFDAYPTFETCGVFLDNRWYHIKEKMFKAQKRIDIIRKRNKSLPQYSFITIYKSFVRPHLGFGDIIYDQPNIISLIS